MNIYCVWIDYRIILLFITLYTIICTVGSIYPMCTVYLTTKKKDVSIPSIVVHHILILQVYVRLQEETLQHDAP